MTLNGVDARDFTPDEKLDLLKDIVEKHSYVTVKYKTRDGLVHETVIDVQSANAMLQVYDHLQPHNQRRMLSLPWPRMAQVAWQLTGVPTSR